MKLTKATKEQRAAYRGVYPLHGFITVKARDTGAAHVCAVEFVGDEANEIKYEVIAPDRFHFGAGELVHTKLCANLRDVFLCGHYGLEPCGSTCAEA